MDYMFEIISVLLAIIILLPSTYFIRESKRLVEELEIQNICKEGRYGRDLVFISRIERDGKNSDKVLVYDSKRNLHIATFNEGQLDNTEFKDWYDERDYLLDNEVIAWNYLTYLKKKTMDIKRFEYILNDLVDKGDINLTAEIRLKQFLKDEYNTMKGNCNHIWNAVGVTDHQGPWKAKCIKCGEIGNENLKK